MKYKEIEEIAVIYGKKGLILELLEKFHIDRQHDEAILNAILLKGDMKKEVKRFVFKGD
jgi:hypothetical protein